MAIAPELPYLGAGIVALIGGTRREGKFPENGIRAVVATAALVLAASVLANTRAAPLVRAIGIVLFIASVFGTTRVFDKKGK